MARDQQTALLPLRSGRRHTPSAKKSGPDLLPSGLYRRPRSFTGSWGVQVLGPGFGPPLAGCTADRELERRVMCPSSPCPEGLLFRPAEFSIESASSQEENIERETEGVMRICLTEIFMPSIIAVRVSVAVVRKR